MERRGRAFTSEQVNIILERMKILKETDELALLVFLLMETNLKLQQILGWFNTDPVRRKEYLKDGWLSSDYASAPKLFPKSHQAYLNQWKRICSQWFGIQEATFEMLKRSKK